MSRSSNSDSCKGPLSAASAWIAGARRAVIQSSPAGLRSASIRALVIIPRSPTSTTRSSPKRSLELVDLGGERARVGGIALEHLDGDRAAIGGAQQPEDDLQLVPLAVAAVAEPGQLAAAALEIARGEVVEHQAAVLEMAPGQRRLDLRLRPAQQIEGPVELVLVDRPEAQHRAQRMRRRRLAELARRRQLGRRLDHPRHDQRQRQLGQPLGPARQQPVEAELAGHAEHRRDMAVRQGPLDRQPVRRRRQAARP